MHRTVLRGTHFSKANENGINHVLQIGMVGIFHHIQILQLRKKINRTAANRIMITYYRTVSYWWLHTLCSILWSDEFCHWKWYSGQHFAGSGPVGLSWELLLLLLLLFLPTTTTIPTNYKNPHIMYIRKILREHFFLKSYKNKIIKICMSYEAMV